MLGKTWPRYSVIPPIESAWKSVIPSIRMVIDFVIPPLPWGQPNLHNRLKKRKRLSRKKSHTYQGS